MAQVLYTFYQQLKMLDAGDFEIVENSKGKSLIENWENTECPAVNSTLEEENTGPYLDRRFTSLSLGGRNSLADPTIWSNCTNYFSMPIRRKRSSPTSDDPRNKKAKVSNWSRRNELENDFSSKRCIAWFHEYTDSDEDVLGPEGMEKFCEDIGVEPENIVMLCLAWKLEAKAMGFFSKAEWLKGMTEIQCDCISKLQGRLDYLRSMLDDPVHFKNIYRYAYDFARNKDQRSMDVETAKAMLGLLLGKHWTLFGSFHQFIEQSKYKVINKDQWCNILEFSRSILPDLSNYDEDGAWPVLLDEFVEWYRENKSMSS